MLITIYTVGKNNSNYVDQIKKYTERLDTALRVRWEYLSPSSYQDQKARDTESADIIAKLGSKSRVWLLDETGQQVTSPALADKIDLLKNRSVKELVIIIGGAYGVNQELKDMADWVWSLSALVFPHDLVRLILVEQLYRADQINKGTAYHHH